MAPTVSACCTRSRSRSSPAGRSTDPRASRSHVSALTDVQASSTVAALWRASSTVTASQRPTATISGIGTELSQDVSGLERHHTLRQRRIDRLPVVRARSGPRGRRRLAAGSSTAPRRPGTTHRCAAPRRRAAASWRPDAAFGHDRRSRLDLRQVSLSLAFKLDDAHMASSDRYRTSWTWTSGTGSRSAALRARPHRSRVRRQAAAPGAEHGADDRLAPTSAQGADTPISGSPGGRRWPA